MSVTQEITVGLDIAAKVEIEIESRKMMINEFNRMLKDKIKSKQDLSARTDSRSSYTRSRIAGDIKDIQTCKKESEVILECLQGIVAE